MPASSLGPVSGTRSTVARVLLPITAINTASWLAALGFILRHGGEWTAVSLGCSWLNGATAALELAACIRSPTSKWISFVLVAFHVAAQCGCIASLLSQAIQFMPLI